MVAKVEGSVWHSYYILKENDKDITIHFFKNETISNTVGGTIIVRNMNNAGITIVQDCKFTNNFHTEGGSIHISEGGILLGANNHFSLHNVFREKSYDFKILIDEKN